MVAAAAAAVVKSVVENVMVVGTTSEQKDRRQPRGGGSTSQHDVSYIQFRESERLTAVVLLLYREMNGEPASRCAGLLRDWRQ